MNLSFIIMMLSAWALPLLALLALLLRRNLFKGKLKLVLMVIGIGLLCITILDTFKEHSETLSTKEIVGSSLIALLTLFILSKFSHGHSHDIKDGGAKGIVISEAFHSLIDGAVIGATYVINPVLGYAATVGILTHELPKVLGTLTLFRGIGFSVRKTIIYGICAQIGSPLAALLVYLLGKQINEEQFYFLEIASISSLGAIILWIIYLEIRFHKDHPHDTSTDQGGHATHTHH